MDLLTGIHMSNELNAVLVSVDYGDLLSLTLPYNRHHFNRVLIITSPGDKLTQLLAETYRCSLHVTDAFYRNGAMFNKWLALEEALTTHDYRHGWLCIMDADVLWPKIVHGPEYRFGNLYTPRRRMMERYDLLPTITEDGSTESLWSSFPLHRQEVEFAGYTQIFHADDPVIGPPPWHQTDWRHAGGADSFFQAKWPDDKKVRPPWEVLHLGPAGTNWAGRVSAMVDGSLPSGRQERQEFLSRMFVGRRGKAGVDRFAHERLPGREE